VSNLDLDAALARRVHGALRLALEADRRACSADEAFKSEVRY